MDVGGERTPDAEAVGAGLLLDDPPLGVPAGLHLEEIVDQGGPLDPGLDLDQPPVGIEAEHPGHPGHVVEHRALSSP